MILVGGPIARKDQFSVTSQGQQLSDLEHELETEYLALRLMQDSAHSTFDRMALFSRAEIDASGCQGRANLGRLRCSSWRQRMHGLWSTWIGEGAHNVIPVMWHVQYW